jgi:putative tryptophan/tyrosine transport system substrate-binding protein
MDRRTFVAGTGAVLLAAPLVAHAQQAKAVPRVAFLGNGSTSFSGPLLDSFRLGLRELGYVEGQSIVIESRFADGKPERVQGLVRELLELAPDVIVAAGPQALRAFKQATASVPIVMAIMSDPVEEGLIASLAHRGGNLTGLAFQNQALTTKRLELLKEAIPRVSRVAVLWDSTFGVSSGYKQAEAAARALQLRLQLLAVRGPADFESAFNSATKGRAEALLVLASPFLNSNRQTVVESAARRHLPATYEAKTFVEIGGLMSYGPSFRDMYRRAAIYVDKILKGAKPGGLPVEQPTKFEFVINLKTAKVLGLTIPQSILARADEVIQ